MLPCAFTVSFVCATASVKSVAGSPVTMNEPGVCADANESKASAASDLAIILAEKAARGAGGRGAGDVRIGGRVTRGGALRAAAGKPPARETRGR